MIDDAVSGPLTISIEKSQSQRSIFECGLQLRIGKPKSYVGATRTIRAAQQAQKKAGLPRPFCFGAG